MAVNEKETSIDEQQSYHYGYRKDFRTALPQIIAVSVKNLLLLGYGMTLGFTTILIPAVRDPEEHEPLHLSTSEISWISSINYIIVPVGCALSGVVTSPMGRRRAMQMVNIPFLMAWLIFHYSSATWHLYVALFLTGLAGGLLEAPVLTYVAEITQPHLRGALSATSSMSIIIGVFLQFLFGLFFYWRTVALLNIVFTVIAVIALFFIPESPHWLVSRNRKEDARKSVVWLRGWRNSRSIDDELRDIQELFDTNKKVTNKDVKETFSERISSYTNRSFLVPYFLVSYAFFVGHFSGMTTLQTYAVSIFQMLDAPIDRYYATFILGFLQILGSAACVVLVHYTGKRTLTHFSTAGAGLCCLFIAIYDAYLVQHDAPNHDSMHSNLNETLINNITNNQTDFKGHSYSWIPTTLMMLLALVTHTGIRLLPWILIGEVFNAKTKSTAAGLSGAIGYIFGFLTNKIYIHMVDMISIWGTYGLYSFICFSGSIVFYYILPETEGKTLNEIENHFAGKKKLTNNVYRPRKSERVTDVANLKELKGASNPNFESDEPDIVKF